MRTHAIVVCTVIAAACAAMACSTSNSATNPVGSSGGHSDTITASSTTTGGAYGSGGNYFFSPTPDTVAAGTAVTFSFGSVVHNVHWQTGPATPDSIPAMSDGSVQRMLTTPGTYTYVCLIHLISGTIVVL